MAFPVYSMERDAWAMWVPWLRHFRRMTDYYPTKAEAMDAKLELI